MASNQNTFKRTLATRRQRTSRANSEDVCLEEENPSPRVSPKSSPSHRRRTKFDLQTSLSDDESSKTESTLVHTDQSGDKPTRNWCFLCRIQVESKRLRLLFGLCAIINILSLVFSAPLFVCREVLPSTLSLPGLAPQGSSSSINLSSTQINNLDSCNKVFIQYVLITVVDFLLAVFYTLQTLARIEYLIYLRRTKSSKVSTPIVPPPHTHTH